MKHETGVDLLGISAEESSRALIPEIEPPTPAAIRARESQKQIDRLVTWLHEAVDIAAETLTLPDPTETRTSLEAAGWFNELVTVPERNAMQVLAQAERLLRLQYADKRAWHQTYQDYKKLSKRDAAGEEISLTVDVKERDTATYQDYVEFINKVFDNPRRCLLSGNLMTWDSVLAKYVPCLNRIPTLKSKISDYPYLKLSWVETHFLRYQSECKPELLITIPEWDGRDRLLEIAGNIITSNINCEFAYHALCDWGAKAWKRLKDPRVRNRILTFIGPQNLGKDWLIEALTGGFDLPGLNYVRSTVIDDNGEINQQLHRAIVFRIEEFDRSSKTSVSQIKHVVTAFNTSERLKYDREAESRDIRASFIASANPTDILRDPTGNERFLIIQLASIKFGYPGEHGSETMLDDRLQLIAQYKSLAESGYKMPDDANRAFREYNEKMSPDDSNLMLCDEFDRLCEEYAEFNPLKYSEFFNAKLIPSGDCSDIFEKLSLAFGIKRGGIQRALTGAGRRVRRADGAWYKILVREKYKLESED